MYILRLVDIVTLLPDVDTVHFIEWHDMFYNTVFIGGEQRFHVQAIVHYIEWLERKPLPR